MLSMLAGSDSKELARVTCAVTRGRRQLTESVMKLKILINSEQKQTFCDLG